jgi:hypothetical protein
MSARVSVFGVAGAAGRVERRRREYKRFNQL